MLPQNLCTLVHSGLIDSETLYYLYESGFDTFCTRLWGYVLGKLNLKISGLKYKRQSVISCSNQNKLVCPFSYSGTASALN